MHSKLDRTSDSSKRKMRESVKKRNKKLRISLSTPSNHDSGDDALLEDTLKTLRASGHVSSEAVLRLSGATPFDSFCGTQLLQSRVKENPCRTSPRTAARFPKIQKIAGDGSTTAPLLSENVNSGASNLEEPNDYSNLLKGGKHRTKKKDLLSLLRSKSQERLQNTIWKGEKCSRSAPPTPHRTKDKNYAISFTNNPFLDTYKPALSMPSSCSEGPGGGKYKREECGTRKRDFWLPEKTLDVVMPSCSPLKQESNNAGIPSPLRKPVQGNLHEKKSPLVLVPSTLLMTKEKSIRAFSPTHFSTKPLRINAYGKYLPSASGKTEGKKTYTGTRSARSKKHRVSMSPIRSKFEKEIDTEEIQRVDKVGERVSPQTPKLPLSSVVMEDDIDDSSCANTDRKLKRSSVGSVRSKTMVGKELFKCSQIEHDSEPGLKLSISNVGSLSNYDYSGAPELQKSNLKIKKTSGKVNHSSRKLTDTKTSHPRLIRKVTSLNSPRISSSSRGVRKRKSIKRNWFTDVKNCLALKAKATVLHDPAFTTDDRFSQTNYKKINKDKATAAEVSVTDGRNDNPLSVRSSSETQVGASLEENSFMYSNGIEFKAEGHIANKSCDEVPLPPSVVARNNTATGNTTNLLDTVIPPLKINSSQQEHDPSFRGTLAPRKWRTATPVPSAEQKIGTTSSPVEGGSDSGVIRKPCIVLADVLPELTPAQKQQLDARSKVNKLAERESHASLKCANKGKRKVPLVANARNKRTPKGLALFSKKRSPRWLSRSQPIMHNLWKRESYDGMCSEVDSATESKMKHNLRKRRSSDGMYKEIDSATESDQAENKEANLQAYLHTDANGSWSYHYENVFREKRRKRLAKILSTDQQALKEECSTHRGMDSRNFRHIRIKKLASYDEIVITTNGRKKESLDGTFKSEYNFLGITALRELTTALKLCQRRKICKAVLLSSVGPIFCSGLDPLCLLNWKSLSDSSQDIVSLMRVLVDLLIDFRKPILAAVQGPAAGFGASILLFCDGVYASDRACIQWPNTSMGLSTCGCASAILPVQLGPCKARSVLMKGDVLTAREAKDRGLVCEVFPHDSLMRNVLAACHQLVAAPTMTLLHSKELLFSRNREELKKCNAKETMLLKQCLKSTACQDALEMHILTSLMLQ